MLDYLTTLWTDYLLIIVINLIFSIIVISLERRNANVALAWLFFMTFLPGIGFFFFLLLSQNISKRKIFKYTEKEHEIYSNFLSSQIDEISNHQYHYKNNRVKDYTDMILFHLRLSESFYSQNNSISTYYSGDKLFDNMFRDIYKAKETIHILFYIVKGDELGQKLFNLLIEKAKSGVEVRLLVDYVGGRHISKKQLRALSNAGVEFAFFFPSLFRLFNTKANYRNHRKVVVIDGLIGYLGGFNVGDEYLGKNKYFGFWRDTHLRIMGDAVISLQLRFILDWRNASKKDIELSRKYIKETKIDSHSGVQIVASGPDSINEQIKQGFIKMIHSAKDYIYIQTPYFIPDESILEALKIAASSEVDVRLMIPSIPDHPFVYWATYSYAADLLDYGVKVYIYKKGFLHAKTIVIDDIITSCGTCNFDIRSFKLNFEVNAFIYDQAFAKEFKENILKDINDTEELTITDYKNRSLLTMIREAISRLLSPIL